MDQAITTLRFAWQRRALFARPLALPLAAAALVTFFDVAFLLALLTPIGALLDTGSIGSRLVAQALITAPLLLCSALAVAMVVAVVADRGAAARWLPTPAALRLAAIMVLVALVAGALVQLVGELALYRLVTASRDGSLSEPGIVVRLAYFVVYTLAWPWAAAAAAAIAFARRLFPTGVAAAPSPGLGRVAAAVLLALLAATAITMIQRTIVSQILLGVGEAEVPRIFGQLAEALVVAGALAILAPLVATAIAVAAFAGRAATRR